MFRFVIFALLVFGQTGAALAAPGCTGADPAITSVAVKAMSSDESINNYNLSGTVVNVGGLAQAPDVLQFVDDSKVASSSTRGEFRRSNRASPTLSLMLRRDRAKPAPGPPCCDSPSTAARKRRRDR